MSIDVSPRSRPDPLYPDSDGKPRAENTMQFRWIVLVKENLDALYRDEPAVFVAGDLLWYALEGEPKVRQAPDAMVVFGRPKGDRGSYKQWEEGGIAPQVVFEILSPGNPAGEMARKQAFYDAHGVEEYYIYDPDDGDFAALHRRDGRLAPLEIVQDLVSPRLGVRFQPVDAPDALRIFKPDGTPFKSFQQIQDEAAARRAAEAERVARIAEQAARAAEQATRNAEQAAQNAVDRAERLAARLRELGETVD